MSALRLCLALVLSAVTLVTLPGCKGPCRQLSEQLCECETNTLAKDACNRRVSNEESRVSPTIEDEARCEALLDQCDCNLAQTREGKEACGLSRESPVED